MNSYQKIKQENKKLKEEIKMLIQEPFSFNSTVIKTRYELKYKLEKIVWQGETSNISKNEEGTN